MQTVQSIVLLMSQDILGIAQIIKVIGVKRFVSVPPQGSPRRVNAAKDARNNCALWGESKVNLY